MSSRVATDTPLARISAAAPSMMRCRVARPFAVRLWTCGSILIREACGLMSPNGTRLAGRTALVTGSTGGLGVAIASALAADGAFVVVSGRDKARGDAAVADIRSAGGTAEFVLADLGEGEHEVRRLAEQATAVAGGRIDIPVNNAAMPLMPTPTAEISDALLRDAFAVN